TSSTPFNRKASSSRASCSSSTISADKGIPLPWKYRMRKVYRPGFPRAMKGGGGESVWIPETSKCLFHTTQYCYPRMEREGMTYHSALDSRHWVTIPRAASFIACLQRPRQWVSEP